jgi:hypothetical protein
MIIDDTTDLSRLVSRDGRGYLPRDFRAEPHGSLGYAAPVDMPLIPEEEYPDLIADMDRNKTSLLDICDDAGLQPMDQGWTNLCWMYGVVDCIQILGVLSGAAPVLLSPESVAGPLTNYANWRGSPAGVGGYPSKGLAYLVEHGICRQSLWKPHDLNPGNDNEAVRADRKNHGCTEWYDGMPGYQNRTLAFRQLMTCLLRRIPCASAHNWMHHVITPCKPIYRNGQLGFIARNSGYGRDKTGHITIVGSRAVPDEWVAPRVAIA